MWENLVENERLEFFNEFSDDVVKTVIAFANTSGGEVLIGIDSEKNLIGVEQAKQMMFQITSSLKIGIVPDVSMLVEVSRFEILGKSLIKIKIDQGVETPYYLSGVGLSPFGVFVRKGELTIEASLTTIFQMITEKEQFSYENRSALNQNLTFEKFEETLEKKGIAFDAVYQPSLGIFEKYGLWTNLSYLFSDQAKQIIRVAVYDGVDKISMKKRHIIKGPFLQQLEEAYQILELYNGVDVLQDGLYQTKMRDYDEIVLRELLINAVMHREYGINADIMISIFDDRLEILSPGGLLRGLGPTDAMMGVVGLRNAKLAQLLTRLNLAENCGTGFAKIKAAYKNYEVQPLIENSENGFQVTIMNMNKGKIKKINNESSMRNNYTDGLSDREKAVLTLLESKQTVTRKEVEDLLVVSQATAVNLLRDMVNRERIEMLGHARNMKYSLKR